MLSSKRGDHIVFENTVGAFISMRLFILSAALSVDIRFLFIITGIVVWHCHKCETEPDQCWMKVPFRRLWYFLSEVKGKDLIRYSSIYNVFNIEVIYGEDFSKIAYDINSLV